MDYVTGSSSPVMGKKRAMGVVSFLTGDYLDVWDEYCYGCPHNPCTFLGNPVHSSIGL